MRVIICGGRNFVDVPKLWRALDELEAGLPEPGIREVIDGASDDVTGPYIGADYWGHQWGLARGKPNCRCHAKWGSREGRAAGPIRNSRMLERGADIVVAFAGGRGTADMVLKAKTAGVKVVEVP